MSSVCGQQVRLRESDARARLCACGRGLRTAASRDLTRLGACERISFRVVAALTNNVFAQMLEVSCAAGHVMPLVPWSAGAHNPAVRENQHKPTPCRAVGNTRAVSH